MNRQSPLCSFACSISWHSLADAGQCTDCTTRTTQASVISNYTMGELYHLMSLDYEPFKRFFFEPLFPHLVGILASTPFVLICCKTIHRNYPLDVLYVSSAGWGSIL
jgi:hypothetical protein